MNKFNLFALKSFLFFLLSTSCMAQTTNEESLKAISLIKEYYTKHSLLWNDSTITSAITLGKKIDSLQLKYCTNRIRKQSREWFAEGHDLLTNDLGINDEALKFMSIKQLVDTSNAFTVSYILNTKNPYGKLVKKNVLFTIRIVKENGRLKIDKIL